MKSLQFFLQLIFNYLKFIRSIFLFIKLYLFISEMFAQINQSDEYKRNSIDEVFDQ